jgi:hypothetical protein
MTYTNPFLWQGKPLTPRITKPQQTPLFNGLRAPSNHRGGITITGAVQGQADAHRRDGIKRGISQ